MRVRAPWRDWHIETITCGARGHCAPAATVRVLRPTDSRYGVDLADGRRLARCLRCDAWIDATAAPKTVDALPTRDDLPKPRRGKLLRDAIVLRVIAVDRAIHAVVFALIAVALLIITLRLPTLQSFARSLNNDLTSLADTTGRNPSRSFVLRQANRVLDLSPTSLHVLLVTAIAYAVIEGVEAVGLWLERRWAEYLTAVATAGFLPFEVHELAKRITVFRVGALVVNLAILAWLVYSKHLFGVRGGLREELVDEELDVGHPSSGFGRTGDGGGC